jgi:hypothetical protein
MDPDEESKKEEPTDNKNEKSEVNDSDDLAMDALAGVEDQREEGAKKKKRQKVAADAPWSIRMWEGLY